MLSNIFEDPNRPLLGPNYWIMKKIGLILPKSKIKKYLYIVIHEIVALFVFTEYLELYLVRSNLDLIITNLKVSMLSVVCVIKSNYFIAWQDKWIDLIDYVTKVDKEDRATDDPKIKAVIKQYTNYCKKLTRFYWFVLTLTFLMVTTTPLMKYLSSPTYRYNLENGIEPVTHVFSSWMPIDKNNFPGIWITIVWHVVLCGYGSTLMMAYDGMVIVVMVFFGGKLDILRLKCASLASNDKQSDKQFYGLLKQLHQEHNQVLHYANLLNSMLSPVMFMYVVMCSLMLCASAFQLTTTKDTAERISLAELLSFGILQLFMFCWHSTHVFYKSMDVMTGPYESQWWSQSAIKQKHVLLLMGKLNKTIFFSAGPYTNLTLATFINILKGAYSYYTLLRKD